MTEIEKCKAGQFYHTDIAEREKQHLRAAKLCFAYNHARLFGFWRRKRIMKTLLGRIGGEFTIETGFQCSFGFNISIGDHFFANSNCLFMDDGEISFGDHVLIGPGCEFYTAQHPINAHLRSQKVERALPITVEDGVWFGGRCVVLPGVTIGRNAVIGAGSVVTRSIEPNTVAAGNPCRVLRHIKDADPDETEINQYLTIRQGGASDMKKRILCYGDSNTWGANPVDGSRFRTDTRWTGVLAKMLEETHTVIEAGYNGRTAFFHDTLEGRTSGIDEFLAVVSSASPLDLIIIMLGTNDLKTRYGTNPKSLAFGFHAYADTLNSSQIFGEKPKVLLVAPLLIGAGYKNNALFYDMFGKDAISRSKDFADAYREIADELHWAFLDASEFAEASVIDGVHMEAEAHLLLANAMYQRIRTLQ